MLGFVIPVKPKAVSKDWEYDTYLLERTVRSACAQIDQNFKLLIIHNELPEINFKHPNIRFVKYPYPPVNGEDIEDWEYVLKHYERHYAEKMIDKGKKILYGCQIAKEEGCDYIMSIDSDDLVSNKLSTFVNRKLQEKKAGWRINKGFIYKEGSFLMTRNLNIHNINGSTHIIRQDLINIPDFLQNKLWNFNLFEAHGYTLGRIRDYHKEVLDDYPFFGVIYIVHRNNYSNIRKLTTALTLKNFFKTIAMGKLLNKQIKTEYGLHKIANKNF